MRQVLQESSRAVAETAIEVVGMRLARIDVHLGRAFIRWVRGAYSGAEMPRRLGDYFERGAEPLSIPSSVLAYYGALACNYLEQPHAPKGLRVQGERLDRVTAELGRRLAGRG